MKKLCLLVLLFLCGGGLISRAQNISNEGTEFWTVFPTHVPNIGSLATMNVNVTSKFNTEVTVSCGTYTQTQQVPANTVVTFLVDRTQSYINLNEGNTPLINRGIHIKVTDGMPKIVAYSHVFANARSAATLILPVEALGREYYSMNYVQDSNGQNFLALIAAEDNTDLIIHKKDGTKIAVNGLNKGDVYEHILPSTDLTGVYVETAPNSICKRFAAFSGTSALRIGGNSGGIDPLLQQLYSVNNWGKTYGVVPFIDRRYIVRVLAKEDNTIVKFDGVVAGTLNKGMFMEQALVNPTIISSDRPISVAQYSYTQEYSAPNGTGLPFGDPEMVLLNPVEFNIRKITLFSSTNLNIVRRYINVFMKTDKVSTFKINGSPPSNGSWRPIPSDPTYSYNQIEVFETSLTLDADDGFNAIAYGFGDHESYAYSAGTNLAVNQYITFQNKVTNTEGSVACIGKEMNIKITLPFRPDKMVWQYGDGSSDDVVNFPTYTTSGTNPVLYTFTAPTSKTFTAVGLRQIHVIATLPASLGNCFGNETDLTFEFDVDPLPKADFTVAATGCTTEEIVFTNTSDSQVIGKNLTKWVWDFGDPASGAQNTSTLENPPNHIYQTPGTYTVKLYVGAENGCFSDVKTQDITVNAKPVAKFQKTVEFCVNKAIVLDNLSSIASGTITNYHWDFGDGQTIDVPTATFPPQIKYVTKGTKTISLTVTSDKGCISKAFSMDVEVRSLPIADFSMPGYCREDGPAIFKNLSTTDDGGPLTYKWDFGDGGSSTAVDGQHIYANAGSYTVTLRVFNQYGCEGEARSQTFIVNTFVTEADFSIDNESNLCSDKKVVIRNTSIIAAPGRIVKLEIYKDWDNDQTNFVTVDYPGNDPIELTYPVFGGSTSRTYNIRVVAYSGQKCFLPKIKPITIKPSPILKFDPIPAVCERDGQIVLTQASETSGIVGKGTYSGPGIINPRGVFNPLTAGTMGVPLTITYTFVGDAPGSCPQSITQTITVNPSPRASSDPIVYMLAEGETVLQPNVEGFPLTFQWSPALGLDKSDVLNPVASPEEDTEYTLTVTNLFGCAASTKIKVIVLQKIEIPSSFSPNGDNVNDIWNIKYLDTYPKATVEIFTRNGAKVYSSVGYKNPFDGNFQNQPLPVGVYYYIVNPRNGRKVVTGSVTLIR